MDEFTGETGFASLQHSQAAQQSPIWFPDRNLPRRHSSEISALCGSPAHCQTKQDRAQTFIPMLHFYLSTWLVSSGQDRNFQLGAAQNQIQQDSPKFPSLHISPVPANSAAGVVQQVEGRPLTVCLRWRRLVLFPKPLNCHYMSLCLNTPQKTEDPLTSLLALASRAL